MDFGSKINTLLDLVSITFDSHPILGETTGKINAKGDQTIEMDTLMEQKVIDFAKKEQLPVEIFSEEIGSLKIHPHPTHLMVFDPLDGSTNYRLGKNLMPYGFLVSIYKGLTPKLKDIVAAGAYEHTSRIKWIFDGKKTHTNQKKSVLLQKKWTITASTPVYFDLYYKKGYDTFGTLPEKICIRFAGSNIGSLLYVLNESAGAMGTVCMRPEEIGTMVALVKGAGGITIDHKGNDLGDYDFSTAATYPMLVGNKEVVNFILQHLK